MPGHSPDRDGQPYKLAGVKAARTAGPGLPGIGTSYATPGLLRGHVTKLPRHVRTHAKDPRGERVLKGMISYGKLDRLFFFFLVWLLLAIALGMISGCHLQSRPEGFSPADSRIWARRSTRRLADPRRGSSLVPMFQLLIVQYSANGQLLPSCLGSTVSIPRIFCSRRTLEPRRSSRDRRQRRRV